MENREEIAKNWSVLTHDDGFTINNDVLNAMQEYSDQQNKHLLDEIERLKSDLKNSNFYYKITREQNKRLLDNLEEVERLKSELKDKKNRIIEIERRHSIIMSEPYGIVRDTMISDLLIT